MKQQKRIPSLAEDWIKIRRKLPITRLSKQKTCDFARKYEVFIRKAKKALKNLGQIKYHAAKIVYDVRTRNNYFSI